MGIFFKERIVSFYDEDGGEVKEEVSSERVFTGASRSSMVPSSVRTPLGAATHKATRDEVILDSANKGSAN
jgi:hypothetical protein